MKFFDDEDDTGEKMLINTLQPAMLAAVVFCMMLFVQPGWLPGIESWLHLCIGGFLTGMVFSFIAFFTVARRVKAGQMPLGLRALGHYRHYPGHCHDGCRSEEQDNRRCSSRYRHGGADNRRFSFPRARLFRLPAHVLRREEEQGKGVGPPETGASPASAAGV